MNKSTELARRVVVELIELGISDVVLSPGSRNSPLSIALFQAEKSGLITLHVRIDERTAAFFALGIAKASRSSVAILCTSGTAAANYHPAILEARHSQLPLLVLTADRPKRLRNTGANQTTEQVGMFGSATPPTSDISDVSELSSQIFEGLLTGPIHLNLQFDEPLLPGDAGDWIIGLHKSKYQPPKVQSTEKLAVSTSRGVIVVGHDRGGFSAEEIENFVTQLGWPLVAEDPLSFSKSTPHSALFLTSAKVREELKADEVIVFGRTTLSRSTNSFVKASAKEIVIDPRIADVDRARSGTLLFSTLPTLENEFPVDGEWIEMWKEYGRKSSLIVAEIPQWSEPGIARRVSKEIPTGTTLFISSSRPIRDIESFTEPRSGIETFANRGLAGIDGNISTALGIASQREKTLAILGDLSFLHDLTGFVGAKNINLRILVIDNDGGGIFSTLSSAGVEGFEKIFGTPHGKDLNQIALAFGISSVEVHDTDALLKELLRPIVGLSIVVAKVPNREENAKIINSAIERIEKL